MKTYYQLPAESRGNNTMRLDRIRYRGGSWAYYMQPGTATWTNDEYDEGSFEPDSDIREVVRTVDDEQHYETWLDGQTQPAGQSLLQHFVSRTLEYLWAQESGAFE